MILPSSRQFKLSFTALNDFVQPAAVGLWNLRWQVRGFLAEELEPTKAALMGRFVAGSGIGTMNFRRFAEEQTWEQQRRLLAQLAVFQGLALFEEWIQVLEMPSARQSIVWPRQGYDGHGSPTTKANCASALVRDLQHHSNASPWLTQAFPPTARSDEPIRLATIDSTVALFRVFKEARNCLIHGGEASAKLATASAIYHSLPPAVLSRNASKSAPALPDVNGDDVSIDLRAAQGLLAILYQIVATFDALVGTSRHCESTLVRTWRATVGQRRGVSPDAHRRAKYVRNCLTGSGFPPPVDVSGMVPVLSEAGLLAS